MSRTKDEEDPINEECAECNAYNPDLAIDVHNNSGGGDGFEVYHTLNGGTGKVLAQNIEKQVIKDRPEQPRLQDQTGPAWRLLRFRARHQVPAVICEGVFVDTKADAAQAGTKRKAAGVRHRIRQRGILDTLGIKYDTSTDKPAEPTKPQDPGYRLQSKKSRPRPVWRKDHQYLLAYKYGEQLVKKLAEAMEK